LKVFVFVLDVEGVLVIGGWKFLFLFLEVEGVFVLGGW
jgi:hypothetical protein